jgi:hypothetical protein
MYQITNLFNYQMRRKSAAGTIIEAVKKNIESGKHEGQGISKENLRQVQDRASQGCGARDLRELETQAETRINPGSPGMGNCQSRVIG